MWNPLSWVMQAAALMALAFTQGDKVHDIHLRHLRKFFFVYDCAKSALFLFPDSILKTVAQDVGLPRLYGNHTITSG